MSVIHVLFRYDDFAATSDSVLEQRIFELFRQYGMPCLVGVVPFAEYGGEADRSVVPLGGERGAMLRRMVEAGVVEPALHGYTHRSRPRTDQTGETEFQGLDGERQAQMLAAGKDVLERVAGRPVRVFIPPYNSYDKETVRAMKRAGLSILCGAMFDAAPDVDNIAYVPHTCALHQLREAVEGARASSGSGSLVMPLFHSFDFAEAHSSVARVDLPGLAELLQWLSEQEDVRVVTMEQAAQADFGRERYLANRAYLRVAMNRFARVPQSVQWRRLRYLESGEAAARKRVALAQSVSAYAVACLLGVLVGMVAGGVAVGITAVACANFLWLSYLLWRRRALYFRATQVSCGLLSALLVSFIAWRGGGS